MKLSILDYSNGKIHVHNVSSQQEVMHIVDAQQIDNPYWMLSSDNEFEVIQH